MPCPTIKVILASHTAYLSRMKAQLAQVSIDLASTQSVRDRRLQAAQSDQERAQINAGYMRDVAAAAEESLRLRRQLKEEQGPLEADIEQLNQWSITNNCP
jgi:hypothetical protein